MYSVQRSHPPMARIPPPGTSFHKCFSPSEVSPRIHLTYTLRSMIEYDTSHTGSAIYIRTSPQSTATVNVSLSSPSVAMHTADAQVNSSIGWISAVGLSEDVAFTIAITYVPDSGSQDGDGGRLDIQFIMLTVSNIRCVLLPLDGLCGIGIYVLAVRHLPFSLQ